MDYQKRREDMKILRSEGKTYKEIGELFGVSRQRVRQITNNIRGKSHAKPPLKHKILTWRKLESLGFNTHGETPSGNGVNGGKHYVREWERIRDRHACQKCKNQWKKGSRRFDVHHLDEEREGKENGKLKLGNIIKWDRQHLDRMITLFHKC